MSNNKEREVKADELVGKGSFADMLRKRRKAVESGLDEETGTYMADAGETEPDRNAKRGYKKENW